MSYLIIKHFHLSLAIVSISFFCVRFAWSLSQSPLLHQAWVKVTPHIVDTLLLSCGVYLMFQAQLWPTSQPWLATKLFALVVYILLGSFAIKHGKTRRIKLLCGVFALLTFVFMVNVAISRTPLLFL
ncbi:SirB2 family protein [Ningiella sp. W23]|uniref:SirB2 family protein n=1 Tax=Ningiella sp. W23 TaxID=3023715 RepID=UPI003757BDCB